MNGRLVGVLRMMAGPSRELVITHLVQDAARGRFRDRDPELIPYPVDHIDQPPAHDVMDGGDGCFDQLGKGTSMHVFKPGRLTGRLPVERTRRPISVETDDPVPDDLKPNSAHGRRPDARAASLDRCQCQKPPGLIGIHTAPR